jgi:hypothetical protein
MTIYEILQQILISSGGASIAIVALSRWIGDLWMKRILQDEKAQHDIALTEYRNQLEATKATLLEEYKNQLETARINLTRFHDSQFPLYNALWQSLHDLKLAGDKLWEKADEENLNLFTERLTNTETMINKNILLIEDKDLEQLKSLINAFWNFQIGKKTLTEILNLSVKISEEEIEETISSNRQIREQYNALIFDIAKSFKAHLRGNQ